MTNYLQSQAELEQHLQDHLRFLKASADSFDRGFEGEAKRIAASLRVLLHDTKSSHSLLGQLGSLNETRFCDSSPPVNENNLLGHSGLVAMRIGDGGAKYVAMLDDSPFLPFPEADFKTWWASIVFKDGKQQTFSRRDIVLRVANQDGGAHVDPELNSAYSDLSRNNSLGWVYSDGNTETPMEGPEKAALRQICHEVLRSLDPSYPSKVSQINEGMRVGGMTIQVGEAAQARARELEAASHLVRRNQACPCGSGRRHKRCCGALG
ncbi:SEC-C metal-binding domain-containing protein [Pseudoxanthomonas sp. UC19_8]|uniref:SEC-C metal-binding domain-containing protein n=1 Tax=Pseudoxanthomonas sp. UC19_8 TaxID=3350175 RepID=UPI0036D24037